jgi:regulator of protease activity HflC (stomatin/prohibitin superfamily)
MGRGGSEDSALGGCLIASCVCFIAVPAVIMIVLSFATLEQTQYGLDYNGITLSVDNITMASSGLYFLGLGHSFIKFPKVVQTIEFNSNNGQFLHTRTSDGLPLTLGVSFQFTYNPTRLYDLYVSYKGQHRHVYENTATAVIANLACNFSAYEFFNDKAGITVAMQARVRDVFARQLYANVVSFQISKVELPASFQAAILESISTKQNITRSERYRDNMMVTFEQQVMVAQQEKNQTITAARGNAARRTQQALAAAQVTNQTVSAEIRAFSNLAGQLDFHSQDGLEYLWWDLLSADAHAGDAGKEFLVGVNPAAYISQGSH